MELLGRPRVKRRRSEDQAAGEPSPGATKATEAANPGPPPPDAAACAAAGGRDGVDRISALPDAVLGEIVSLLSTKEAGRTQILASRWRHVWLASPLVLDGTDLYNAKHNDHDSSESESDSSESDSDSSEETFTSDAHEALAVVVSHILSVHPGPVRRFCIPPLYLHNRPATVDAWLSSPKLDNLQELDFCDQKRWTVLWYLESDPLSLSPLPASTFRFSAALRVATLGKCEILDSSVEGVRFPNLKQLGLEDVSISEGSLHTMISSCPVLECLLLKDIFEVGRLQISSNSIRSIGVDADEGRDDLQFLQEVIIVDAPCLERFLYLGTPINLTVVSAPKLETLGCLTDDAIHNPRLVFGTTEIQGLNVISLTMALSNVKILAVTSWWRINLETVIRLLECFPCLEKLYIKCSVSGDTNRWRHKHRDFIKSFDICLKTVVLEQYRGSRPEVNFASFFLRNARELESMRLEVQFTDYNEAFFMEQQGKLQMEKRASRGALLHFMKEKKCTHRAHVNHVSDLSIADPFECRC